MPDKESATTNEHAHRVREMFASIAARYDLLNHLLSGNVDKRWRRLVVQTLSATLADREARILDVACGTGDLSLTLLQSGHAQIVGIDFCRPMLDIAATKAARSSSIMRFVEGDALELPFADRSFEAATIAFGLRNLTSVEAGIKELLRVLKPGGKVAVLEFSKPKAPVLSSIFKFYFTKLLPKLGGLISGSKSAYQYLPDSVSRFPDQLELASLMKEAGFENISFRNLTWGIAALHLGTRPGK
ncbi:MAG TPA: bifunctional demethylmenaquinone methyltransferase/2-methoxy-6-polyprenyl-1,4-benzoquinol methylase UbiE [Pyrinomonadaceae bacterium]|nr:bifunctional demethylmenaquinone methyltransferase/2-methoxy-6-polyprenyl-1,4-benzoquinol methylase UbiE [Pyrinomonadaceae bacterium]